MIDVSPEGETLETCAGVLREVFGYDDFRGPQAQIAGHVSAMIDISSAGETLEACAGVLQEVFGYDAFPARRPTSCAT